MDDAPDFDRLIAEGLDASRAQRAEAALELFAQAGALAPDSGLPHFLIASEHAARGAVEAAESAFATAVVLAPEFTLARYQLGLLQFSTQRPALALVSWQPLLALPPADPLGHFVRGFAALAKDSFPEALQHYREGLACADINQALAADIRRVVEAVEQMPAAGVPAGAEPAAGQHVLLAGYVRGLH
jgi:tetratricopeptide (TPR) repeat protein